jgi:predicted peroxiredoxin
LDYKKESTNSSKAEDIYRRVFVMGIALLLCEAVMDMEIVREVDGNCPA